MANIPIALELYSVREDLKNDVRGTLQKVAALGYQGVEFAGHPQQPAEELRKYLDDLGLVCCSWHTPFDLVQDDKLEQTIAFNKTMGNSSIIIPGLPRERTGSRQAWLETAQFFNRLTDKLLPHGMYTGYHNHHTEFTPLDGGDTAWDVFFSNTRKEVVMQIDIGNALYGGGEAVPILQKYPGRARNVHLKPYSLEAGREDKEKGFDPLIGEDSVPWEEVFRLCETIGGTEWYIVEYESSAYPALEAVDRCLQALRRMGK